MAGTGKNVIYVSQAGNVCPFKEEALIKAGESLLAGYILIKDAGEFIGHDTAGAGGMVYIADINTLEQLDTSDALTAGDTAAAFVPEGGQVYNVVVAAAQNITATDTGLASNGDGTLKIAASTDAVLFYADEIINTGATAALVRCKVALS